MSIASGAGLNPQNRYRVVFQREQPAQNMQDLFSREDSIELARNANQINPDIPHWVEHWDPQQRRFLRDAEASAEVQGRARNSCWLVGLCDWLASLFRPRVAQPAQGVVLAQNRPMRQSVVQERLPRELADKATLEPGEQASLFFPKGGSDTEDAKVMFTRYPAVAEYFWQQFRLAHQAENVPESLARVRKWTSDHIEKMRNPDKAWELQGLEDSF